jgi:hypothetical protein
MLAEAVVVLIVVVLILVMVELVVEEMVQNIITVQHQLQVLLILAEVAEEEMTLLLLPTWCRW